MQNLTFDKLINIIAQKTVLVAKNAIEGWFTLDINNLIK